MKNIVVPVDFSETSSAALRFGTYLAEVMNLDLRVVHVFDANFSFAQAVSTGALLAEKERLAKLLKAFTEQHTYPVLATFQGNLATLPAIRADVFEGFPSRLIRSLSEQEETALVIMGGVGSGKRENPAGIFGGVARQVALNGGCPVILLPPGSGYPEIDRMAIAFGDADEISGIDSIARRLIKVLRPEVRFVHVAGIDDDQEWKNDEKFLEMTLASGFPGYKYGYDTLPSGPVAGSLLEYARKEEIGLLVLAHRKRSFWTGLFTRGNVKPIINHCATPILVVPLTPET